jgi:hypothetical protein
MKETATFFIQISKLEIYWVSRGPQWEYTVFFHKIRSPPTSMVCIVNSFPAVVSIVSNSFPGSLFAATAKCCRGGFHLSGTHCTSTKGKNFSANAFHSQLCMAIIFKLKMKNLIFILKYVEH